jgi:hypothetical protein
MENSTNKDVSKREKENLLWRAYKYTNPKSAKRKNKI